MTKREVEIIIRDSEGEKINYITAEEFIKLEYILGVATGEAKQYVRVQESNSKFCEDLYEIGQKMARV